MSAQDPNPVAEASTSTQHHVTENKSRKKAKRRRQTTPENIIQPCFIKTLPIELLAEILQFTESPRDVLAVSRTSKFFCNLLVDPAQSFIWKAVRQTYPVPPPDPMSVFSEIGYASLLFDGGNCTLCDTYTVNTYHSFGIRMRLCHKEECNNSWKNYTSSQKIGHKLCSVFFTVSASDPCASKLREVLPYAYGERPPTITSVFSAMPFHIFRRVPGLDSHNKQALNAYAESHAARKEKTAAYMTLCGLLKDWKDQFDKESNTITAKNMELAHNLALKHGWDKADLKTMTEFGRFCSRKNKRLELVTQDDVDMMKDGIDQELVKLSERRLHRKAEKQFQDNRQEVLRQYHRLQASIPHPILPPLDTFRQLPIVSTLQGSPNPSDSTKPIGNSFKASDLVKTQLQSNLDAWKEKAKSQLAGVLGYPNWKTASKTVVHPVERVTARFRCKSCSKLPAKYRNDECFDFAGACAHQCSVAKKNKRSKEVWKASNFARDEKAISAIEQVVKLTKTDLSLAEDNLLITVRNVVCVSCNPPLALDWKALVGHCHRHDNIQLRSASAVDDLVLTTHAIPHGIVKENVCPGHRALIARKKVHFGCRHCAVEKQAGSVDLPLRLSPPALFSFDGLRSHMKAKHNIEMIRDEDVLMPRKTDSL